ncbi:unnamed protein product [Cochlearia groenlandica]
MEIVNVVFDELSSHKENLKTLDPHLIEETYAPISESRKPEDLNFETDLSEIHKIQVNKNHSNQDVIGYVMGERVTRKRQINFQKMCGSNLIPPHQLKGFPGFPNLCGRHHLRRNEPNTGRSVCQDNDSEV